MTEKYNQLVKLQKETVGATFIMGYSLRSGMHYLAFTHPKKRFESKDVNEVLQDAINYVQDERRSHNDDMKFTLNRY